VVIDPPAACQCCGGNRLRKLGEDVTRTLESVPRQWKVAETVRGKVHLPGLRENQPGTGAIPCDPARMGGAEPAGHAAL